MCAYKQVKCVFVMSKGLDYDTLNENVKKTAYAVRGELYLRASELQKQGKKVCVGNSFPISIDNRCI